MAGWKKIVLGTLASGAVIGTTVYVMRLNKMSAELETVPKIMLHKLDLTGITIRIDVQLKNPTRTGFKIKFPFIKLVYNKVTVGSSQAVDKDITIPPFGEAVINAIMVKIPMLSLFSQSGGLIRAMQNKDAVKMDVKTLTTIDLGWRKVPYTKSDTLTLSNKQA
jgi:hypothetical protein